MESQLTASLPVRAEITSQQWQQRMASQDWNERDLKIADKLM